MPGPVLIVTGGYLHAGERSLATALRKQALQWRSAEDGWLDAKVKLVAAEPLLLARAHAPESARVSELVDARDNVDVPELTSVLLATLLRDEGVPYTLATTDDVQAGRADALIEAAGCVFLSSTLLRDVSELEPLARAVKRPGNRVVVGGALAGALLPDWDGLPEVDVLAVGYGELLVPALAAWWRRGFTDLQAPDGGRVDACTHGVVLHAGLPDGTSLDALPVADWSLAERDHARAFPLVHYESVRGCPYRCAFCNYPFLFADDRFRYRSAERVVDDWARYADAGARVINCLDSLFTMPKRRLVAVCEGLIERGVDVEWVCYARADDLADEDVVRLMVRAGARLVHVGIESGDQGQLDRMAKRVSVDANAAALTNARKHGLATLASLVIKFPGETEATLARTLAFLREHPPDFHYLAVFNTRVEGVPVLEPDARARFGLATARGARSSAPYWKHETMDCLEACTHARNLETALALDRVSLNAAILYGGLLRYRPEDRAALLAWQRESVRAGRWKRRALDAAHAVVDRGLRRALRAHPALAARAKEASA